MTKKRIVSRAMVHTNHLVSQDITQETHLLFSISVKHKLQQQHRATAPKPSSAITLANHSLFVSRLRNPDVLGCPTVKCAPFTSLCFVFLSSDASV